MIKAGGILGIIGGIFGILAALATLLLGGIGSAFEANGASTVVGLGWGGIAFSVLSIVCGAVVFAKPKGAGIALVITAIGGMVGGGMLVALCMVLSLIGGILSMIGAKKRAPFISVTNEVAMAAAPASSGVATKKISPWVWGSAATLGLLLVAGMATQNKTDASVVQAPVAGSDPLDELAKSPVSDLQPDGQLAATFTLGSQHTDLQRENALKEIKGKLVSWTLPVYEVKREDEGYKIQTSSGFRNSSVGAFVSITPRTPQDRQAIESLKTGDLVSFRGVINDVFMRNMVIKPAILEHKEVMAPVAEAPLEAPATADTSVESGSFTGSIIVANDGEYSAMTEEAPDGGRIAIYFKSKSPSGQAIFASCKDGQVCAVTGKYRIGAAPDNALRIPSVLDVEWISVASAKAIPAL